MPSKVVRTLLSLALVAAPAAVPAAPTAPVGDAADIALDAYVYFYPLVTMDVTRKQFTNIEAGKEPGKGPMNTFAHIGAYPPADFKGVVRPNFDTLYSPAWIDLSHGPVTITVPDTNGRYYLLPMLDMWTDVFASPGARTTSTGAGAFVLVPPGWHKDVALPNGAQRIDAPTDLVWIIGRTKTDGPSDYDAVHRIQAGYRIDAPATTPAKIDASIDMKTAPKEIVDRMPAAQYFACAAELLAANPPHLTDQPILAQMKRLGIEPGRKFDASKLDPATRAALDAAPAAAQKLMAWKLPSLARVANGWSMNTDTMGVYGNYYLKRAIIAQAGLGANLPEDAIYPLNLADREGKPLTGAGRYTIHFDKSNLPPVHAFWSITLYDNDGFQVANALDRFAVSSWMPFRYNTDGSLDLYFQSESPGKDKEANWLPSPTGPYNLTMRLYSPKREALTGQWNPPVVTRTP